MEPTFSGETGEAIGCLARVPKVAHLGFLFPDVSFPVLDAAPELVQFFLGAGDRRALLLDLDEPAARGLDLLAGGCDRRADAFDAGFHRGDHDFRIARGEWSTAGGTEVAKLLLPEILQQDSCPIPVALQARGIGFERGLA